MAAPIQPIDLQNAKQDTDHIAAIATSTALTATDRLGRSKLTMAGVIDRTQQMATVALGNIGYLPPVEYAAGIVFSATNQTVSRGGIVYAPRIEMLPFTTSGLFETDKFRVVQSEFGGITSVGELSGQAVLVEVPRLQTVLDDPDEVLNAQAQALLNRFTYLAVVQGDRISVTDPKFAGGADPSGLTDSTAAFIAAKEYAAERGGGSPHVPLGTYMLTDFDLDVQRVIFDGDTGGYTYEKIPDPTKVGVRLIPGPGARWVFRIKGVTAGNAGASAQGSGLRNVVITDTSPGAHLIGLLEDSAGAVLEDVTIQGFQYNHVMPGGTNGNKHTRVASLGATKAGVVRSEYQAAPYMWPEIPDVPQLGHTVIFRDGCVTRQNEFGIVDRDGIGGCFANETAESNLQSGLYYYRTDVSTVRGIKWDGPHFENNYDGIQQIGGVLVRPDGSPYTITGNRAFLIGDSSTYIAWDPTVLAGGQVVIDSQTHAGTGGPDGLEFNLPKLNCNNSFQRDLEVLSGTSTKFYRPNFGGTGDEPNRVRCRADANGTIFYLPSYRNDPTADVPSLVSGFGANLGTRGVLIRLGVRNGDLGGLYTQFGAWGGAAHLPGLPAGDPRRADLNLLHRYVVLDVFAIPWRTASALPFTLTAEDNTSTLIGREVTIKCEGSMTVSTATASPDKFFANATLPYQTVRAGKVVGQVVVKPTGGGASVLNNGCSPMEMPAIASAQSVLDIFPPLTVGMTFSYQVELRYTLAP